MRASLEREGGNPSPVPRLRVGLDTNALYTTQAGCARYVRGLLRGLRTIPAPGLDLREIAWPVENLGYRQPARALKTFYRELIWANTIAPRRLRHEGIDLLHSTVGWLIRPPRGMKHIASLMDLALLRHPERYRRWQRQTAGRRLARLARVDRILCISRFTADEAMALLGLPASKLEVTYLGCDFPGDPGSVSGQIPDFPVPNDFFLFVGSLEPGKNLALLREVYLRAEAQGAVLPPLLIVGVRWAGVGTEGPPPREWHYLGRLPDAALVYLYRRALALVFPSKYEGFGLPVLEAMTLGCPVICSPVASLPEVGGQAVLYCDLTAEAYGAGLRRVAADDALRQELSAKGRQQATLFSWDRCAAETLGVYREVAG
jgi:alpha-1,3-rhamnosyl/mannosyltransferase